AVLVTGGAGNLSRGHRRAARWGPLVEGELADRQRLRAAIEQHQVAAVMHFAAYAYAYVGGAVADPAVYLPNKFRGLGNIKNLPRMPQPRAVPDTVVRRPRRCRCRKSGATDRCRRSNSKS